MAVRTSDRWPGESLSRSLEPFHEPSCILVGAGISYPDPSGIPTASTCLELLFAALPLRPEHREELRAAISPDWPLAIEQADFLRFEQAMGAVQATIDAELAILLTLISDARPNRYHFQLAHLLT